MKSYHITASEVQWYGPGDPARPRNWSTMKRAFVVGIICLYTFVVYTGSAIYIIGIQEVTSEFRVREQEALLGLSLYVLGYGLGPLIWAPLTELSFIGRNPVYAGTYAAFFVFSILSATTRNWSTFLSVRFLQAFFGSPCLANGGASMHDLFSDMSVPYSLNVWIAAAYCGPALGPLIAGFVVPENGWRWGMWEIVCLAAPTFVLIVLLPETYEPTILARRAKILTRLGQGTASSPLLQDDRRRIRTLFATVADAIVKPVQISLMDPAVGVANLYTSFVYGTYYTLFDAFPRIYPILYGFSPGQLGLVFLCVLVACFLAGCAYSIYVFKVLNVALRQHKLTKHEDRLRPALVAVFLPPIGLFLFGWTANGTIHWIVGIIGITIYSMGTFIILQCLSIYIPRIYPRYAASLFAANDFCRSSLAAGAIHFGVPLYENLGVSEGISVLAGVSVLGIIGIWIIYWKGPKLRAKSRFISTP